MDAERQRQEIRRWKALGLAISDMHQAQRGAAHLARDWRSTEIPIRRVVEAGTVVCYARPFASSRAGYQLRPVKDGPSETDDRSFHKWLLGRRDDLYAHNDATPRRHLFDVPNRDQESLALQIILEQEHGVWESYDELTSVDASRIVRLGDELIAKYESEQAEIAKRLASTA